MMTPPNRLAIEVSLTTGLRIGDVLAIRAQQVAPVMRIRAAKTGKVAQVEISAELCARLRGQCSPRSPWVWPGRTDPQKHRTRQAVWADFKRAVRRLGLPPNLSVHSARKSYAMELLRRTGDYGAVQDALQHDTLQTTLLYLLPQFGA